ASLERQARPADEVSVVDGGSQDTTVEILRAWEGRLPLRILEAPGTTIAQGRNVALAEARGDIVAVTDGGVVLAADWLERLIAPFAWHKAPDVVSGFFRGAPQTATELALAVTTLPDADEIDPPRFLPSSRSVAFRRSLFLAGIRYPEWLDYCEDIVFDLRLLRAGARFTFEPRALVFYQPRSSLRAFAVQYFRYARGDGKAGLFAARHAVRYATYLAFLPLVAWVRRWPLVALALAGAAAYLRRPYRRLWRRRAEFPASWVVRAALLIPIVRLVGDLAKQTGYPIGLWWRWRHYGLRRTWRSIPESVASPPKARDARTPRPKV
ncbi:MAG: glycosyltransferase, partial [Thermomicrobium sp.]